MDRVMSPHLTDDQFAECALAAPNVACQSHLDVCDRCRNELARFHASMNDFDRATSAWSESMPRVSLRAAQAKKPLAIFTPIGWAAAAALLIIIGTPLWVNRRQNIAHYDAATSTPQDSAAQIAQDNRMMQSVYVALAQQDPSPFQEYGLSDLSASRKRSRMEQRSQ